MLTAYRMTDLDGMLRHAATVRSTNVLRIPTKLTCAARFCKRCK